MSNAPSSFPDLLRLCIVRGTSGPWSALLSALEELVDSAFRAVAPPHHLGLIAEFRAWLPGWLIAGQRLERAHSWLDERIQNNECPTVTDQELALRNYLQQTIRSGVGDFFRERSGRSVVTRSARPLQDAAAETLQGRSDRISTEDQERLSQIQQHLAELPLPLRVPFRLRHYGACGPLPPEEATWVAEQAGLSAEEVESRIQAELHKHQGAEFPLSAEFIGVLLHIPAAADGRFTTVDQRVSRARQRLRDLFTAEESQ